MRTIAVASSGMHVRMHANALFKLKIDQQQHKQCSQQSGRCRCFHGCSYAPVCTKRRWWPLLAQEARDEAYINVHERGLRCPRAVLERVGVWAGAGSTKKPNMQSHFC